VLPLTAMHCREVSFPIHSANTSPYTLEGPPNNSYWHNVYGIQGRISEIQIHHSPPRCLPRSGISATFWGPRSARVLMIAGSRRERAKRSVVAGLREDSGSETQEDLR
jgi:hypothetical protein